MATKRWSELDPRLQQAIKLGAAFEAGLKIAALIDLARHSGQDVHGSKAGWAAAITVVNAAGLVPILYFLFGRRVAAAGIVAVGTRRHGSSVARIGAWVIGVIGSGLLVRGIGLINQHR